jgi:hypothetical protein
LFRRNNNQKELRNLNKDGKLSNNSIEWQVDGKIIAVRFPPKRENDPFFYQRAIRPRWNTKKY